MVTLECSKRKTPDLSDLFPLRKAFSEKIRWLRVKNNLSLQYVATYLGMTKGAVHFYEIGKRDPSFETLQKLATLFKVEVWSLFLPPDQEEEVRTLLENYAVLPENRQKKLVDESHEQVILAQHQDLSKPE